MSRWREHGPAMTLGNMRANGVRSLAVWCNNRNCGRHVVLDVAGYADDVLVPSFGGRLRCVACGGKGAEVMPNWNARHRQAPIARASR